MDILTSLLAGGVSFLRTFGGIIIRPYETYRRIADRSTLWEFPYLAMLLAVYFSFASLVKAPEFRPYLLTKQFAVLSGSVGVSFILVVATLWLFGSLVGGAGKPERLMIAWAYTLVPTTAWFLATSFLYVLLPPPRTDSLNSTLFSVLYLVFTITLFLWKFILYYLTLRFSLRLDLSRIVVVTLLAAPLFTLYSIVMYRFGIFRIPFL